MTRGCSIQGRNGYKHSVSVYVITISWFCDGGVGADLLFLSLSLSFCEMVRVMPNFAVCGGELNKSVITALSVVGSKNRSPFSTL